MLKKEFFIIFVLSVIFTVMAIITIPIMYFAYTMIGIVIFLLSKKVGKEIYLAVLFISGLIATELTQYIYFISAEFNPLRQYPWDIIIIVISFLEISESILKNKFKIDKVKLFVTIYLSIFLIVTIALKGFKINTFIHNYLCPTLILTIIYNYKEIFRTTKVQKMLRNFIAVGFIIGILGYIEYLFKFNMFSLLYMSAGTMSEFNTYDRIKTIIGHALNNGIFFLMNMILCAYYFKKKSKLYLSMMFFAGDVLITGSRSIFIISIVLFLVADIRFNINQGKKVGLRNLKLLLPLSIIIVITLFSPLGNTFITRMSDNDGSANARFMFYNYFIENAKSFKIGGIGSSGELVQVFQNGIVSSIIPENPWLLLFMDMSYLALLYVLFLFLLLKQVKAPEFAIILLMALTTYNSFGVLSNVNFMLFLVITFGLMFNHTNKVNQGLECEQNAVKN